MKRIVGFSALFVFMSLRLTVSAEEEVPAWARERGQQTEDQSPVEQEADKEVRVDIQREQTVQDQQQPREEGGATEGSTPAWAKEPVPMAPTEEPSSHQAPIIVPIPEDSSIKPTSTEQQAVPSAPPAHKAKSQKESDTAEQIDPTASGRSGKRGDTSGLIYEGRTAFGASSIVGSKSRIGVMGGYLRLPEAPYDTHYLHIDPRIEILWEKFALSLMVPLNFKLYDAQHGTKNMWEIRRRDWDEPSDYSRIVRFIKYGRKDDRLYLNITTLSSSTLGHGTVMRRYIPNVDLNHKSMGIQFDVNHDYIGFQSTASNIFGPPVFGIMPFVRPFAPFSGNLLASSLSIGLTFVADSDAPITLKRINLPNYLFSFPNGKPYVDSSNRLKYDSTFLYIWGIDAHIKVVRTKHVDIKPYIDWSTMKDGGWGFTGGLLWRFSFGENIKNFFTIRTDYRAFRPDYEPTYFNTFYEFQKYQYFMPSFSDYDYRKGYYPTKLEEVLSRTGEIRNGYYLELNYELSKYFAFGTSIENATGNIYSTIAKDGSQNPIKTGNGNFLFYVSLPLPYFLSAHFTYHKIAYTDIANILDLSESNTILLATLKFRPINLIGIYASLQQSWELDDWTGLYIIVPQVSMGVDLSYYF